MFVLSNMNYPHSIHTYQSYHYRFPAIWEIFIMILILIEIMLNISTYLIRRIGRDREHNVVDLCWRWWWWKSQPLPKKWLHEKHSSGKLCKTGTKTVKRPTAARHSTTTTSMMSTTTTQRRQHDNDDDDVYDTTTTTMTTTTMTRTTTTQRRRHDVRHDVIMTP